MKILHINKSDKVGGASVAAMRLVKAQRAIGLDSQILVQEAQTDFEFVHQTSHTQFKKKLNFLRLALEKLYYWPHELSPEKRFVYSMANTGENIHNHPLVKEADIIHLHWFNQGFLSLKSLRKLARNKIIVWTLHDMWAFTGGCHYSESCEKYMDECTNCLFIKGTKVKDKSNTIFYRKKQVFENGKWHFITPSFWLKNLADQSSLIRQFKVENLPNAIDLDIFRPMDKKKARNELNLPLNKKIILFGAMNVNDSRKGMSYFIKALEYLQSQNIENQIALAIFGKSNAEILKKLPFTTYHLGMIENELKMATIYQAVDTFVIPSLEDNLPNTVVESHASGLPVVAFDNSGLSEMIHHEEDGYLAHYLSSEDLAVGIRWVLFEADYSNLAKNARINAEINYEQKDVANKHLHYYEEILAGKFKKLDD